MLQSKRGHHPDAYLMPSGHVKMRLLSYENTAAVRVEEHPTVVSSTAVHLHLQVVVSFNTDVVLTPINFVQIKRKD